jgi:beta-1,2-mannosidase
LNNGMVDVLYRAEDKTGPMEIGMHTSRLGLAESADGIDFTRRAAPVFYPEMDPQEAREWPGGVEDPRIVEAEDGTDVLAYTQWNRQTDSVGIATSPDLLHWTQHGPAFADADAGKYAHLKDKSAGIVTTLRNGRLIAVGIGGSYWMSWGEGALRLATSPDLIHWTPVEDARGEPVQVLGPRPGHFGSDFPETGPPPVLAARGIVLVENGKNAPTQNETDLPPNTYASGEARFDRNHPAHLLARTLHPVLEPVLP